MTPLEAACRTHMEDCNLVAILLAAGANPHAPVMYGVSCGLLPVDDSNGLVVFLLDEPSSNAMNECSWSPECL